MRRVYTPHLYFILAMGLQALLSCPRQAVAATATTTFTVSASVVKTCILSANSLAFGPYTLAANDATTTISLNCTNGTAFNVGLNAGTGVGATVTNRLMTVSPGTATLPYALFSDTGRTTNWGNTVGTDTVSGTAAAVPNTLTVFGRIAASIGGSPAGNYTDTITVTVTY